MSRYLPLLLISLILCSHLVSAQVTTGTISGVVQDSSGAVITPIGLVPANSLFQGNGNRIGSAGTITALTTQPRQIQFALKVLF